MKMLIKSRKLCQFRKKMAALGHFLRNGKCERMI